MWTSIIAVIILTFVALVAFDVYNRIKERNAFVEQLYGSMTPPTDADWDAAFDENEKLMKKSAAKQGEKDSAAAKPKESKGETDVKVDAKASASVSKKSGGLGKALAVMGADSQISLNRRINALSTAPDGRRSVLGRTLRRRAPGLLSRGSTRK